MVKPVIFALTGGVASGKSAAAQALQKRGACVIDADAVGHEVLREAEVKNEIVGAFGTAVLAKDGGIDRKALGAAVFGDDEKLARLNAITHPRIRALIKRRLQDALKRSGLKAVVLDVSLLLESGAYEGTYDVLVFVAANESSRVKRAAENRGWSRDEVRRRQKHQLSLEQKQKRAAVVIDNNGSLKDLDRQVGNMWKKYIGGKTRNVIERAGAGRRRP